MNKNITFRQFVIAIVEIGLLVGIFFAYKHFNPVLCAENEYVSNHICEPCTAGRRNEAGERASGNNTICDPILCDENEYVSNHICEPCTIGSANAANDDAFGNNTTCDPILCAENEYVSNHICEPCIAGAINEAGDNAFNENTICEILCAENEYVRNHVCEPCAAGSINTADDNALGNNTTCYSYLETAPEGFTLIPAGSFMRGSSNSEHEVTITRSFYMQTHEVTQGEWQALMRNNPSRFSSCGSNCPVENVNWFEALAYANALSTSENLQECYELSGCRNTPGNDMECSNVSWNSNCFGYRLPTEAEWEYAIRANTTTDYYNGNRQRRVGNIAWYYENSSNRTHSVGQKEANSWGLYDMSGNVWEWCWDWHGNYSSSSVTDPIGPNSGYPRVLRGGSWHDSASYIRSAYRYRNDPGYRARDAGFRLVSSAP